MKINAFKFAREVSGKSKERVFPASFWFNFRFMAVVLHLHTLFALWMIAPHGLPVGLPSLLFAYLLIYLFTLPVVAFPLALYLKWAMRVRVAPGGINEGTIWGTPVYMTWAEMESVEPRRLFGCPYLRVKSFRESCPALWLPSYLADPEAFKQCVMDNTSLAHPLRRSLENGSSA